VLQPRLMKRAYLFVLLAFAPPLIEWALRHSTLPFALAWMTSKTGAIPGEPQLADFEGGNQ
jgi:hypothetical protein